jgi:hypothetical protein
MQMQAKMEPEQITPQPCALLSFFKSMCAVPISENKHRFARVCLSQIRLKIIIVCYSDNILKPCNSLLPSKPNTLLGKQCRSLRTCSCCTRRRVSVLQMQMNSVHVRFNI